MPLPVLALAPGECKSTGRRTALDIAENRVYTRDVQARKVDAAEVARSCACVHLRRAARVVTQLYEAALGPSGLKATQLPVLVALDLHESVPLTRVAELLVMDRTTLSRNLQPLTTRGWVAVERGPDRRERYVTLTPAGRAVLEQALPLWHEAHGRVMAEFGTERLAALVGELDAVIQAAGAADRP